MLATRATPFITPINPAAASNSIQQQALLSAVPRELRMPLPRFEFGKALADPLEAPTRLRLEQIR
ncbi:hypothetical protein [Pseudomonas sp. CDFA 610]|uniref:hypothetical protein n=1 Tax=Pseudomonas sp. CDFA 610 TaxID=2829825 RepID=UPI001E2C58B1|nr:hypothetical protein [Pseudomonas sp. CDFA 610]MCD5984903.1 hypothetical protein [Pseudomonas sp. CDFA 610]